MSEESRGGGKLTDEVSRFVEDFGLLFEERGATRISGRIFGYLLICDPPHQTAAQLTEALDVSKGSVSTMVRYLLQMGWIERFTIPGERSAYYRIRPEAPRDLFAMMMRGLERMRLLTQRGLDLVPEERPELQSRCRELYDAYSFLEGEMRSLIERLDDEPELSASSSAAVAGAEGEFESELRKP